MGKGEVSTSLVVARGCLHSLTMTTILQHPCFYSPKNGFVLLFIVIEENGARQRKVSTSLAVPRKVVHTSSLAKATILKHPSFYYAKKFFGIIYINRSGGRY